MSGDEFDDYTLADILKLMIACGASQAEAEAMLAQHGGKLDAALETLAKHGFNTIPAGGPKAVVGRFHFRLRKAITNSIKIASGLLTAGVGLVAFLPAPHVGGPIVLLGGASAVAAAIDTINDLFKKMTDEEVYVYCSILDIARNDHANGSDNAKKLTALRLKQWFKDHYEAPPNHLDAILAAMETKGVLKKAGYDEEATYSIVY
jgi:hypothetical protein